jgi:hypothetical protein
MIALTPAFDPSGLLVEEESELVHRGPLDLPMAST